MSLTISSGRCGRKTVLLAGLRANYFIFPLYFTLLCVTIVVSSRGLGVELM